MKTLAKIWGISLAVILLVGLLFSAVPTSAGTLAWTPVSPVDKQFQAAADCSLVAVAPDGNTVFVYDNVNFLLYKSTNGGKSFSSANMGGGLPAAALTDIAVSKNYASDSMVVVSSPTQVYRSINGGGTFGQVGDLTGGVFLTVIGTRQITSIDVTQWYQGGEAIVVGYGNVTGPAATGGVAVYTTTGLAWTDYGENVANAKGWPAADGRVLDVKFSPNHQGDAQILALVADAAATHVYTIFGSENWNATIVAADITAYATPTYGVIAFPADYEWSANNKFLIGTGTLLAAASAKDDVYSVSMGLAGGASRAVDTELGGVNTNSNIASIAINGNFVGGQAIVGQFGSLNVKRSADISASSVAWSSSSKTPQGGTTAGTDKVTVGYAGGMPFAATTGATAGAAGLSGFYKSDDASKWYGASMIDIDVKANVAITDFSAVDNSTFYALYYNDIAAGGTITANDAFMVWKTTDAGATWQMVWAQKAAATTGMMWIQAVDANTVYAAENGTRIWKTTDGGTSWIGLTAPAAITAFEAIDTSTYYTGATGAFYKSGRWTTPNLGAANVVSIVVAPDGTIYVGSNDGDINSSSDDGKNFGPPIGGDDALGNGNNVTLALDVNYATNGIIYAGSDGATTFAAVTDVGLFRWTNGVSATWLQMDSGVDWDGADNTANNADDQVLTCAGIAVAADGTLYATSTDPGDAARRTVSPTGPDAPVWGFQSVATDLGATVGLVGVQLKTGSNVLYALATGVPIGSVGYATRIYTYTDGLTLAPVTGGPAEAAITPGTAVTLSWTKVSAPVLLTYTVDVSTDADFANKINANGGAWTAAVNTTGSSITFSGLLPGTTYWWRVYVSAPIVSAKSAKQTFTPMLSAASLQSPAYGEDTAILRPTFSWLAVPGADRYIFELCDNPYFLSPIATNDRLMHTTYALDKDLDYSTTYYWRVKAVRGAVESPVSESVFTIKDKPVPPVPPVTITQQAPAPTPQITLTSPEVKVIIPETPVTPSPVTPMVIWAIIVIGAVLVIAVIVLIVRTRRVP